MFKSLRTKYIVTFLIVVVMSFLILWIVMMSLVRAQGKQIKQTIIENKASNVYMYLNNLTRSADPEMTLDELVAINGYELMDNITNDTNELSIVIVDADGKVLAVQGEDANCEQGDVLPDVVMSLLRSGATITTEERAGESATAIPDEPKQKSVRELFSGTLGSPELVVGYPIFSVSGSDIHQVCGAVIVYSQSASWEHLTGIMTSAILIATVIVLVIALIAVSVISLHVTSPLKRMNKAVKEYAKGDFSARVTVKGKDEVAQLGVAFNRMAEDLGRLETMRNSFLANVSHDLRTPMTTIGGFVDGILQGFIPPEKEKHYLEIVSTEIKRLSRLVSSLLDISKMEAGDRKFVMTSFDICEMGRQILISSEQRIDKKHLDVTFDCDEENIYVEADRDAIYQVFYNLCDNAVKYSSEGARLVIRIAEQKGHKVLITVFNEGQGIPDEDQPLIFERFYKADKSRSLDKSGLGLGLYIVKTIIKAHGEDIWVRSEYGKNCEFGFTLTVSAHGKQHVDRRAD